MASTMDAIMWQRYESKNRIGCTPTKNETTTGCCVGRVISKKTKTRQQSSSYRRKTLHKLIYWNVSPLYVKSSESCLRDEIMMYIGGGQDSEDYGRSPIA